MGGANSSIEEPEQARINELDSAPSVHFDSNSHSEGVGLKDMNQTAVFHSFSRNKLAFLNLPVRKDTKESIFGIKVKVKIEEAEAILGYSNEAFTNLDQLDLAANRNLCFLAINSGRVCVNGRQIPDTFPKCTSSGVIYFEFDTDGGVLTVTVTDEGRLPETKKITLPSMPEELWPLVGVIKTSQQQASFSIEHCKSVSSLRFEQSYGSVQLSSNGREVSRGEADRGNSFALVNRILQAGQHSWTLRVKRDCGASLCLGVAKHPFSISDEYRRNPMEHLYSHRGLYLWRSYKGLLYRDGVQQRNAFEALGWAEGSDVVVQIQLDLTAGTMEIIKNGKSLGVAFNDLHGPLQPIVAFYAGYKKSVELVDYSSTSEKGSIIQAPKPTPIPRSSLVPAFDAATKFGDLELSGDCRTITRNESQTGNSYCLLNRCCKDPGLYSWSFLIESDVGASTCLGVALKPVTVGPNSKIYSCKSMYLCRSYQGLLYLGGNELTPKTFREFWRNGTTVDLTLAVNGDSAMLQYTIDGVNQGVAFCNVPVPAFPVVAFYAGMKKQVRLLHFEYTEEKHSIIAAMNDLSGSDTETAALKSSASSVLSPLFNKTECTHYNLCMHCNAVGMNVVALPCKHAIFCADHITTDGSLHCLVCDERITGVWNIIDV